MTKNVQVMRLAQVFVNDEEMSVLVKTEGDDAQWTMSLPAAREIAGFMAEALRQQSAGLTERTAGALLVPGELQPVPLERMQHPPGSAASIPLHVQSPGATAIRLDVTIESAKKWVAQVQMLIHEAETRRQH